jgi:magnesium-transporting ATPase (P-type)
MAGNVAEIIALIIGLAYRDAKGSAVYPMSPVQVLFLNMLTSSPPAMGLGLEPASPDLMRQFPRDESRGLFSTEAITDIFVYGIMMGGLTLANWSIVLYSANVPNPLGSSCNSPPSNAEYNNGCEFVYRARSTSFLTLTFLLMLHAYNCRSMRYSILVGKKFSTWQAYMSNKFLLGSVVFGLGVTVISVYIPWVNTVAFKQLPIDWEWALVLGSTAIFLLYVEAFKYIKRHYWHIPAPHDENGDAAIGNNGMEIVLT